MPTCMAKKKATCTKEATQKLLITTSSDDHRITLSHTLHMNLIQPEFSIDIHQSLHMATPIYMLGTLGGNNHRGGCFLSKGVIWKTYTSLVWLHQLHHHTRLSCDAPFRPFGENVGISQECRKM